MISAIRTEALSRTLRSPLVPILVTLFTAAGLGAGAMLNADAKEEPAAAPLAAHEVAAGAVVPGVSAATEAVLEVDAADPKLVPEQEVPLTLGRSAEEVAAYISSAYRIALDDARQFTQWAIEIGSVKDIDPLLILAVAATESSFKPTARSRAGAEGLMQVMTKVHKEKFEAFGGVSAALEPYPNMVVGTTILAELVKRTGSVAKGLKWYSGAAKHKTDYGYGAKVLKERSRLAVAAAGEPRRAVELSRAKQGGSDYRAHGEARHLGYTHWTNISDSLEDGQAVVVRAGAAEARGRAAAL